jgi:hypothetical protein
VEFKEPYLVAMREQNPEMFMRLRRSGQLDRHLQEKRAQAHQLLAELLSRHPNPGLPERREAEEQVRATLIDFPPREDRKPDYPEPPEDLPGQPKRGPRTTSSF